MHTLPATVDDLLDQLDANTPLELPDPSLSERELWIYVGRRTLVQELLLARKREHAEGNILNGDP